MSTAPTRPRRWLDLLIAVALLIAGTWLVIATNDMGFVRDEAFYFRHSETYQNWFVDVEAGGDKRAAALKRDAILETWRNNSEHPPLNKILFGYSWRLLGRKLRPVSSIQPREGQHDPHTVAEVRDLGPAHGFEKDARVRILAPQLVGGSAAVQGRDLAAGVVIARGSRGATVRLDPGADVEALQARCVGAGPGADGVARRTGCEALEDRGLYLLSESDAMRAPGAVFAALLVAAIFLAARGFFLAFPLGGLVLRRPFALLAACGYLLLPRPFYHAHLCTFDTTIAALLFVTTVAYHRSLRSRRWVVITALLWGVSMLAKHNALFFPTALIAHWMWDAVAEGRVRVGSPGLLRGALAAVGLIVAGWWLHPLAGLALALLVLAARGRQLTLPPLPKAWFVMLPTGMVMLVLGWPLLWVDATDNFLKWMEFHLHHEHYMQQYFHQVLAYPPFPIAFPWVMTLLTWTLPLLAVGALGAAALLADAWQRRTQRPRAPGAVWSAPQGDESGAERRSYERLLVLSALWPVALIAMPSTPIFGGTKHWFLAYPFMLLIAGYGTQRVWEGLCRLMRRRAPLPAGRATALAWMLVALIAIPSAQATWEIHPHGTAYYNELIGGAPGAAEAGMQRQFWGGATRDGLAEVNRRAPAGARIWFHKCAYTAVVFYQREGWLRRDLHYAGNPEGTALGFYHHQKDHDDYELDCMRNYGVQTPAMQASVDGVPLLSVYERPR